MATERASREERLDWRAKLDALVSSGDAIYTPARRSRKPLTRMRLSKPVNDLSRIIRAAKQ